MSSDLPFRSKQARLRSNYNHPTRRGFIKGTAIASVAAMIGDRKMAFASSPCEFADGNGLPAYWGGWNVITDNPTNLSVSTFSKATPPAVVARDANHLDLFVIGNDSKVWTDTWTLGQYNSSWGGWNQISGGPFSNLTPPAAASRDVNHLDVFVVGNDSKIWWNAWNGNWGGWVTVTGGPFSNKTAPAVVARDANHLDLFVIGNDSKVWWNAWNGNWAGWVTVTGGPFSNLAPPVAIARDASHLDLFVIGNDNRVWWNSWNGSWAGWYPIGSNTFSNAAAPAVIAPSATQMQVFVFGTDGKIYTCPWTGSWGSWTQVTGGPFSSATPPTAVARSSSEFDLYAMGNDGRIWANAWDATTWCGWGPVSDNPNILAVSTFSKSAPPVAVSRDSNHVDLLVIGNDSRVWRNTWGTPQAAVWVPQTTSRICQMTGNYDPAGLPHINNTDAWAVVGTDMGCPVEFNGNLYFFFGDVPLSSGDTNINNADPICYTTATSMGANGVPLSCITQSNGVFQPYRLASPGGPGGTGAIGGNQTPTGAFTYNGLLYVFCVWAGPNNSGGPYGTLTSSSDPSQEFNVCYNISDGSGYFWQIAPWVIQNSAWPGLPSSSGDGLLMWGVYFTTVYLAWMPLQPGVNPPTGIQFYTGNGTWSTTQSQAVPVCSTIGITQISVTYLTGPQKWLMMYTRASTSLPHESVVCRIGTNPWTWSDEIALFNPDREGAWGQYMHLPGSDTLYQDPPVLDSSGNTPGYAYSPYLLNRYTAWNPTTKVATIYYLMATGIPYQVQLMTSQLQFG